MAEYRRPESVLVIVYTAQADVLLLKRVLPFAFWQSVTGSLDADESMAQTARRELEEETGLTTEGTLECTGTEREFEIDPRWRNRYAPGVFRNNEYEFHYRLARICEIRLDASEHSEYRWTDIDSAIELVWSWTNKEALRGLKDRL